MTLSVGIIPTTVGICSYMSKNNSYICKIFVLIIPALQKDVLHFVPCLGIILTYFNSVGILPTKFYKNSQ